MLRSNIRLRLVAAGLALCGGLAAASPALASTADHAAKQAPAGQTPNSTFVVGNTDAVDTLNPFLGFTSMDYEVYELLYDNLMDYGQQNYAGTPRLAKSWKHSKNGLVWTYHIRHGVKWSDGKPLTAADVAYTFQRNIVPNSTEFA
ncbi:MAG: ABC transporter substrate-binding protein, partial [Streptosporangiaceae bacterium]